ncbi:long-chain-fatty-acid--CoA ligase [Cerasibacillus terrae]|uniref:Long-chain-fatty-acid--CoA ligase n=1 Tax=Cerasibacillus terrae TaxID=2498845 RepID=A0A5C8P2A5_9BACI|nr:long-chain-fatty-acid--CoA ligase [Cerasibacillus terrae]TXL67729.1 long-chain-fatty-acid--CoA ligase [Cerasibacillus terrae]
MSLILTEFLDRAVHLYGKKPAIIDEYGTRYTYEDINKRVNSLSYGLSSLDVQKGDRVAYLAPNTLEMYEGFYGIFQVGGIMVSLNTRLLPSDYVYILNHSESKVLFVDHELVHLIEPVRDQLKTIEKIIVHGLTENENDLISYDEWLKTYPSTTFPRVLLSENDVSTLLYTSGTTGNPKGVMLTHRNNYLHALSAMHHLRVSDRDVLMHILPMFHVNGWGSPFYYTANGSTQVMQKKVDPKVILEKMEKYGVTVMHMAPTVLQSIMDNYENVKPKIEQNVRIVVAGAAPPKAFIKQLEEDIGWEFYQVYGMTESSPLTLASYISSEDDGVDDDEYYEMKVKTGYEMIGSQVRVVDELGNDVEKDGKEVGEIIVKGPGVMKGYWKDEEQTNATIIDGWLHTGDMGTMDEDRRIRVVDRKKDIIISGGENISSIEIENVLYDHPAVQEVAVIATPHEKWGETPHAVVVLRSGHEVTEQQLIDFTREHLAHFKCPRMVTIMDELPKTASGKILKVQLREYV